MIPRCSVLFFVLCSSIAAMPQSQAQQRNEPESVTTIKVKSRLVPRVEFVDTRQEMTNG
jgi:hypothetical protein